MCLVQNYISYLGLKVYVLNCVFGKFTLVRSVMLTAARDSFIH